MYIFTIKECEVLDMNVKHNVRELIGHTPLMEMCNYEESNDLKGRLYAKLEYFNPAGSAKDRVGLYMILDAKNKGLLKDGATIIEPTSGNTGIGIASVAASMGYKAVFTMPDTMSEERRKLLAAYGAQLVLTDGKKGMSGAIEKAKELEKTIPGAIVLGQFDNGANPKAHEETTGVEIWDDLDGQVDVFVAGVGTGGTITGVGRFLKCKNKNVEIIAVEPDTSAVLSGKKAGSHKLQGIGAGFVPSILDATVYDKVIPVSAEDAYNEAKAMARIEGILVGVSSGAALYAAKELAMLENYKDKNIVVLMPDTGERYLSTPNFLI